AECVRQIIEVIHSGDHTNRNVLRERLVQGFHGLFRLAKLPGFNFDAQSLRYPLKDITRPDSERGAWYPAHLNKRQMAEKDTCSYPESHGFGNRDAIMLQQIGGDAALAVGVLPVLKGMHGK